MKEEGGKHRGRSIKQAYGRGRIEVIRAREREMVDSSLTVGKRRGGSADARERERETERF